MADEIYEISYDTKNGSGLIKLNCNSEKFEENLRVIEQTLANNGVKNIVYVKRFRNDDDEVFEDVVCEQQMLPGMEELLNGTTEN